MPLIDLTNPCQSSRSVVQDDDDDDNAVEGGKKNWAFLMVFCYISLFYF